MVFLFVCLFTCFVLFVCFCFFSFLFLLLFFAIVVFSYLVCLFCFILLLFYFLFGLFVSCLLSCLLCVSLFLQLFQLFLLIAANGREGFVLSSTCFFFLLFFCRGKGYLNSLVGRVRDSSSAGHSMTYVLGGLQQFCGKVGGFWM